VSFNLAAVMDGMAATIKAGMPSASSGVFAYPVPSFVPPCVIVGYPDITFDLTAARGADTAVFPLWFVAGRTIDSATRDTLSTIIDGVAGVKYVLESNGSLGGVADSTHVRDCRIESMTDPDGTVYWAARFTVEVIA
jgi:hypothetical protein